MRIVNINLAGQKQTFEYWYNEEELQKFNAAVEKIFGKPVTHPKIDLHEIQERRYKIAKG